MEDEEIKHTISDLAVNIDNKIADISKSIEKSYREKKEYAEGKLGENPIAYIAGAFVGGVIMGYLMSRGK